MKLKRIRVWRDADSIHEFFTTKSWAEIKTRLTAAGLFVVLISENFFRK